MTITDAIEAAARVIWDAHALATETTATVGGPVTWENAGDVAHEYFRRVAHEAVCAYERKKWTTFAYHVRKAHG
jgi:hypothetical protein